MLTKKILIIDDEPTILRLLEFVLCKSYDVTTKRNGYEAVHLLESGFQPDLIVLDIVMPYFDGIEFFNSIKVSGRFSSIPVVVLTGDSELENIKSKLKFPVELIMKKPFNPEILKDAIQSILSSNAKFANSGK